MKNLPLLTWMEDIDPVLIERADNYRAANRKPPYLRIVLVAAAVLLLFTVALSAVAVWRADAYLQENYPNTYDGTVLHALDIMLTQDDNAFSNLLLEENREALHILFDALRGLDSERDEQKAKPSEGLEFTSLGANMCMVSGIGTCTDTDVVIPQYDPNGNEVVGIQKYAFNGCTEIRSITVQEGIQVIEDMAFSGCTSLESVIIADSVHSMGVMLFADCSSLKHVQLPSGITFIGSQLFGFATGLESITVPDSVTVIYQYAFDHCSSLKSIEIPDSVEIIEHGSFRHCTSLTTVTIPDGITMIQYETFNHCDSMTSIVIPKSVTKIESEAFWVCKQLKDVYYMGTEEEWAAIEIGSLNNALESVTVHYNYVPDATK